MDYSSIINYASIVLFVMACLVFGVNIIVEVVKSLFAKVPTTVLTVVLSLGVTMSAFFAWAAWINLQILWYYVVAAFVLGLFVAYAAMFGFDKFKDALERLRAYQK